MFPISHCFEKDNQSALWATELKKWNMKNGEIIEATIQSAFIHHHSTWVFIISTWISEIKNDENLYYINNIKKNNWSVKTYVQYGDMVNVNFVVWAWLSFQWDRSAA